MPQLALGVGIGVTIWTQQIVIATVDVGTLGAGAGVPLPVIVPPTMIANMIAGFASFALIGIMSPVVATGIANGLMIGYLQGLTATVHPTTGVGSAVAKFIAPPAAPTIMAGLASAGMIGLSVPQLGAAIGMGLDLTFLAMVMPIPIVGAAAPSPGGGVGVGKII